MKRLILAIVAAAMVGVGPAQADPGGLIPMPGLCEYPFVGISGMVQPGVGQAGWYGCRGMQEAQGQYWIQGLGYYSSSGNAGGGGILGIDLAGGGGLGITGYFCLDDPYHPTVFRPAPDPKPPSAWKNAGFVASKCEPLGEAIEVPGFKPPVPPGQPGQFPTGVITNPSEGNPVATAPENGR
jgi:hypothetical protein